MKLNKGFEFTLESTKQVNLLNKLGNEIGSKESNKVYYPSDRLDIRRNKNIMLIFLSKQKNGYIVYVCNGEYRVGDFMFYTHKEVERICETWELKPSKEKILFNQWRMLWYKDSVISEFVDPLEEAELDNKNTLIELESQTIKAENAKKELEKIRKRFA